MNGLRLTREGCCRSIHLVFLVLLQCFSGKGRFIVSVWTALLVVLFQPQDAECRNRASTLHTVTQFEGVIRKITPSCVSPTTYGSISLVAKGFEGSAGGNVSCIFIPAALYPQVANFPKEGLVGAVLKEVGFGEFLNVGTRTPAAETSHGGTWECDVPPMPAGTWIPVLFKEWISFNSILNENVAVEGAEAPLPYPANQSSLVYSVSDTGWKNRLIRSGLTSRSPGLMMAEKSSQVSFEGIGLSTPASCSLSTRKKFDATFVNSTMVSCTIMGYEGDSVLTLQWGEMCFEDIPVHFFRQPSVTAVHPDHIPKWGKTTITLGLTPFAHEDSRPFVPQRNLTNPYLKINNISSEGTELVVPGKIAFLSDTLWEAAFVVTARGGFETGNYSFDLTLNGLDYVDSHMELHIDGPYVKFLSPLDCVEEGSSSQIKVSLSAPISKKVSARIALEAHDRSNVHLINSSVTWEPGEFGEKSFLLRAEKNAGGDVIGMPSIRAMLQAAHHADIEDGSAVMEMVVLKDGETPHFGITTRQVLYPGDGNANFTVALLRGLDNLGSVLRYSVHIKKDSVLGCGTSRKPINETSGILEWFQGETQKTISVPVIWEELGSSAQLYIGVNLEAWKISRVDENEVIIAHIFGVSKEVCPPGTKRLVNDTQQSASDEVGKEHRKGLKDVLSIEGYGDGNLHLNVTLVPYFSPSLFNYTAMVPDGVETVMIKVGGGVGVESAGHSVEGSPCVDSSGWTNSSGGGWFSQAYIQLRGRMMKSPCILEVWLNSPQLQNLVVEEGSQGLGTKFPHPLRQDEQNVMNVYQIRFLQLSPPSHAILRAVEVRNLTHIVMICGPLDKGKRKESMRFRMQESRLQEEGSFEVIPGHPTRECHHEQLNMLEELLGGSSLVVIPQLANPNVSSTRVEVSGVFLQGFDDSPDGGQQLDLMHKRRNDNTILATVIQNLPEETSNLSISFDIRVTAEDMVTTKLYKFVLGNPSSHVKVFASGSTYDLAPKENGHHEVQDNDKNWPHAPSQNSWCESCPRGMYSPELDSPQCSPCPPGHYTDSPGGCECEECRPGTFTYTWASESCRSCMVGTFSDKNGSHQCRICEPGWTTYGEGYSSCMVPVQATDLSKDYAIIASFGVLLNGTSLEEISDIEPGVNGSGVAVLSILIRKDMSEAFNISMGDIAVTEVSAVGHRVLLVNVTTTFKVPVSDSATEEEREAAMENAMLEGDSAISEIANDADRALQRTTKATNAHAQVSANDVKYHQSQPRKKGGRFWLKYGLVLLFTLMSIVLVCGGLGSLWCRLRKKHRKKILMHLPFFHSLSWYELRLPSGCERGGDDLKLSSELGIPARHRVLYQHDSRILMESHR